MLSGTLPRGCSVCERHRNGLRLTAAGPSGRMAGCILDPARVDIQKVKCDSARRRSAFSNDGSDRAEGRATFCNDGRDRAEERASFCRLARSCGGDGAFSHRGRHSGRGPADFFYRRPRSCGGPTAFRTDGCVRAKPRADFCTGSRHSAEGRMTLSTGARHCALTRPVSEHPSALARPPVQIFRLVFVPSGRP
jgi:hypothetical protein